MSSVLAYPSQRSKAGRLGVAIFVLLFALLVDVNYYP
jgi:hypothetical protein